MIHSPGPVIIDIGQVLGLSQSFPLRWYGLLIGSGFLLSLSIIYFLIKNKANETQKQNMFDLLFWVFIGGIIGARTWFVLLSFAYFVQHPSEILAIWHGGQSIQGGFVGGIVAGLLFYHFKKADQKPKEFVNRYEVCDLIALVLPIAQAIGRFGNYFNIEAFGKPTNLPWGFFVPVSHRPLEYIGNSTFHPTFFYEAIYLLIVAGILFWLFGLMYPPNPLNRGSQGASVLNQKKEDVKSPLACQGEGVGGEVHFPKGLILPIYLILYSLGRIFFESIRIDSLMIGPFAAAHVVSFVTIAIAVWFVWKLKKDSEASLE